MKVKFKRLHKDAVIPKQSSEGAGGWDVVATEIIQESEDFVICKLGFALELPKGYKLTLVPRSSLTKTKWIIQNSPGLGDEDYRGEYQFRFRCIPTEIKSYVTGIHEVKSILVYENFPYKIGDRIAQCYLEEVIPMEFEEVDELEDTIRNSGGFGSTGK
jgi:dUTP pyrophosphatase